MKDVFFFAATREKGNQDERYDEPCFHDDGLSLGSPQQFRWQLLKGSREFDEAFDC